jgi:uncharacterized membrane protein
MSYETLLIIKYFHLLSGFMFMTILWYFNFIHIPMAIRAMFSDKSKEPNQETIEKVDTAMLCFRLGIIVAWGTGVLYLWGTDRLLDAFLLRNGSEFIGVGAWIGTILMYNTLVYCSIMCNVWSTIFPQSDICKQKLIDGETPLLARKRFIITTRIDWALSMALVFFMMYGAHGGAAFQ